MGDFIGFDGALPPETHVHFRQNLDAKDGAKPGLAMRAMTSRKLPVVAAMVAGLVTGASVAMWQENNVQIARDERFDRAMAAVDARASNGMVSVAQHPIAVNQELAIATPEKIPSKTATQYIIEARRAPLNTDEKSGIFWPALFWAAGVSITAAAITKASQFLFVEKKQHRFDGI